MRARGPRSGKPAGRESALVAAIVEKLRATPGLVVRKRHGVGHRGRSRLDWLLPRPALRT